jgi:hypothetical protein
LLLTRQPRYCDQDGFWSVAAQQSPVSSSSAALRGAQHLQREIPMRDQACRRVRRYGFVISTVCITTFVLLLSAPPMSAMWQIIFAPGVVGFLLLGGVHSGADAGALVFAYSLVNGLFWAGILQCVLFARNQSRSRNPTQK